MGRGNVAKKSKRFSGDDGRPDWVARKTCNYLTGSIEVRGVFDISIKFFESPELIVTDNQMLSYSQDCGNKLVESGCVSQEEVDNKTFVHVFVVVDIFNQMIFLLVC